MTKRNAMSASSQSEENVPQHDPSELQAALEQGLPDRRGLDVLGLFRHTGVADKTQIQAATGLSRDQVDFVLAFFQELAGNQILARVPFNVRIPGKPGNPPNHYTLGEAGAAILRANDHPNAHACKLDDARPIAHARAMLETRLLAEQANLPVQTDCLLTYDDDQVIRPDNLVTLPGDVQAIYEIEQDAGLPLLRRIIKSVHNKAAFFRSQAGKRVSRTVRVLFNLSRRRAWDKTLQVWRRATTVVAEERGGKLPFDIVAMPLLEFSAEPDWAEPPNPQRWEPLFDPAEVSAHNAPQPKVHKGRKGERAATTAIVPKPDRLPTELKRRSLAGDRRILRSYWHYFQRYGPEMAYTTDTPRPDPMFFELMQIIYDASHPPDATPFQQAAHPVVSLYLLRRYLEMHPRLRDRLSSAMTHGRPHTMRWNVTTIEHRMQVVIDTFLRYHGFRYSPALRAYPTSSWGRAVGPGDFGVAVHIHGEVLMDEGQDIVLGREEVQRAGEALAWVLYVLFADSEYLQIKPPPFW